MVDIVSNSKYIGFYPHKSIKGLVVSRHFWRKCRLLLMDVGKVAVEVYNYSPMISFHKHNLYFGVHIGFLRLKWRRY